MKILFTLLITLSAFIPQTDIEKAYIGKWTGAIEIPQQGVELPIVFHVIFKDGKMMTTMDSPDQNAFGITMDKTEIKEGKLVITATQLQGKYEGKLEKKEIKGTWTQAGQSFELNLKKQGTS